MLIYWFLPMILLLGIVTSYEDIKFGKIRNKWIILALAYSIAANIALFSLKYYDTDYNNSTFFKDGVRIAVEAGKIITVVTQKTMDNIDRFIKF